MAPGFETLNLIDSTPYSSLTKEAIPLQEFLAAEMKILLQILLLP
jgi:hypothetical protein